MIETQENDHRPAKEDEDFYVESHPFFHWMARKPVVFLVTLPVIYSFLIGFGWSVEDKVEENIRELWVPQGGQLARDHDYQESLGVDNLGEGVFAAMAASRDGKNILTANRLEEVQKRMQDVETFTIEYKGNTYTWEDICAQTPDPYEIPCNRLTPMDLFKEARWYFSEAQRLKWYKEGIRDLLLKPRLPRFGIMANECTRECIRILFLRQSQSKPLELFSDLGNMEFSDPCRVCIEDKYTTKMEELFMQVTETFESLSNELVRHDESLELNQENAAKKSQLEDLASKLRTLKEGMTHDAIVDFFSYYVARGLYSELGADVFLDNYKSFEQAIEDCHAKKDELDLVCPVLPNALTKSRAKNLLLEHADGPFSSVSTAGAPYPFWSNADGTGALFAKTSGRKLYPISGSGISMSADINSLTEYLANLEARGTNSYADPSATDLEWSEKVEANPYYSWFMASVTPAEVSEVCGNQDLPFAQSGDITFDALTMKLVAVEATQKWCTSYDLPNASFRGDGDLSDGHYSKQHMARMWYDLLIDSQDILDMTQGEDDPYTWTTGQGCGYELKGERFSYTGKTEQDILVGASADIYNIDEGAVFGPVDRNILMGGAVPEDYNAENPLQEVQIFQTLYPLLVPKRVKERVTNCHRPGGPIIISSHEALEVLNQFKEKLEEVWSTGWDDPNAGEVQFVSFTDAAGGSRGSVERMLDKVTLESTTLLAISIGFIALFSALFLFSFDLVASRVLITLIGVGLVVLSFFAAIGAGLLVGIKINVTVSWALPFVIVGLGVDDVYIILLALKRQGGYTERNWQTAMKEVLIPVTMTSLVNLGMFSVLQISTLPAVYEMSKIACMSVTGLYLSVLFCFPAYCYLDLKRQAAGRKDFLFCIRAPPDEQRAPHEKDFRDKCLYEAFYRPLVFGHYRRIVHLSVILISFSLMGVGMYGISQRKVGMSLQDFFPEDEPAGAWSRHRSEVLASWAHVMKWGAIDYTRPSVQTRMIQQFEGVVDSPHVAQLDTKQLWMSNLLLWSSRHCIDNFDRAHFDSLECGRDRYFAPDDSYCSGTWVENELKLHEKNIYNATDPKCYPYEGGICRPGTAMHPLDLQDMGVNPREAEGKSYCPVIDGWSKEKWQFCLVQWRNVSDVDGGFLEEPDTATAKEDCESVFHNDAELVWPIPISEGPAMFSYDLFTHDDTLDMLAETRAWCDDDKELHCMLSGIAYDYWTQYETTFEVLVELSTYAILTGFAIALIFFMGTLLHDQKETTFTQPTISTDSATPIASPAPRTLLIVFQRSLLGALLIAMTMILTLVPVVGGSILADVNLTDFANMSFVLSIGFAVEYSVHIVSRWLRFSGTEGSTTDLYKQRVQHTMSCLTVPTFMSFVASTIGVLCLAFSRFDMVRVYFFRSVLLVLFISYWYGCWFLPVVLVYLDPVLDRWSKANDRRYEGLQKDKTKRDLGSDNSDNQHPDCAIDDTSIRSAENGSSEEEEKKYSETNDQISPLGETTSSGKSSSIKSNRSMILENCEI